MPLKVVAPESRLNQRAMASIPERVGPDAPVHQTCARLLDLFWIPDLDQPAVQTKTQSLTADEDSVTELLSYMCVGADAADYTLAISATEPFSTF